MSKRILTLLLTVLATTGCMTLQPQLPAPAATQQAQAITTDISISAPTQEPKMQVQNIILVNGTSFGMCLGYCTEELEITASHIFYRRSSNQPDMGEPPITHQLTTDSGTWSALKAALELSALNTLPEIIGCPDCADGGREWVIVTIDDRTTRVEFEYDAQPKEISTLLMLLRNIREELSTQFSD